MRCIIKGNKVSGIIINIEKGIGIFSMIDDLNCAYENPVIPS
jgi:hypothetical protein